ncbi:hypothetical protein [uncultured Cohaesibacter sp.]|uniref:hypothetical protein n=1 Tax=uncultured Cohaesibacter sp. TaxID=1002546 RepID=UPI00292CC238|nr:hypothetical protein [uncultured Cohaesibacter sp.]
MTENFALDQAALKKLEGSGLVDLKRLEAQEVIEVLRSLVYQSVAHIFENGDKPHLSRSAVRVLVLMLAGTRWLRNRKSSHLGFLKTALHFSGDESAFHKNLMAQAVGASEQRKSWRWRLLNLGWQTNSGLLGSDELLPLFFEVAWCQPALQLHVQETIRRDWKARTILDPSNIAWPDRVSLDLILILVVLALLPENQTGGSLFQRISRFIRKIRAQQTERIGHYLSVRSKSALNSLGQQVDLDHLVAMDVTVRMAGDKKSKHFDAFCQSSPLMPCFGDPERAGDGTEGEGTIFALAKRLANGLL